jgi:hypothetical protein
MKRDRIICRVSVGFSQREWQIMEEALRICFHAKSDRALQTLTPRERNMLLRNGIWAISNAIVRTGFSYAPLACELRHETEAETAVRLREPLQQQLALPDNIVPLFPAA